MIGRVFAIAMIFLSVGAACGYFWAGDIRRGIYWSAAAILTASVTI